MLNLDMEHVVYIYVIGCVLDEFSIILKFIICNMSYFDLGHDMQTTIRSVHKSSCIAEIRQYAPCKDSRLPLAYVSTSNAPYLSKISISQEILDSFRDTEFWYVDQGIVASETDGSTSFRRPAQRQEEKWWLPIPNVPPGGLHENTRKQLQHKRECTSQILKAAMAINSNALAEMEVPEPYLDSLPKNAKESLGDVIYRYITSGQFSPECLLDCLEFSSEHQALQIANRIEESIFVWRRTPAARTRNNAEKRELFSDRAESLLLCLKQRFPSLTQTTLDMSKIQFNKVSDP